MTKEEAINILQNIDPQCQKDCPVSRDVCAKQENRCLVSDALEYAVDFLSNDVVEVKHGHWKTYTKLAHTAPPFTYKIIECSLCRNPVQKYWNFCPWCGADMRERKETNE